VRGKGVWTYFLLPGKLANNYEKIYLCTGVMRIMVAVNVQCYLDLNYYFLLRSVCRWEMASYADYRIYKTG
jgi:hypothetical protein